MAKDQEQLRCCKRSCTNMFCFFYCTKFDFGDFIEAKRDTYWQHCYCDTSLLWGPQISTFSVYSTTKSQLLHVFDNYKFTLYPAHSHLCPCTPSLFILSSSPYSAHGHKSPFCCFSGLARHPLSPSCLLLLLAHSRCPSSANICYL